MKEETMNFFHRQLRNEDGVIIVIALFVLALLTIMVISASTTTSIDQIVASNDKYAKVAFYHADAGVYATPKLISKTIDEAYLATGSDLGNFSYLSRTDSSDFFRQVMGFDTYDGGAKDVEFTIGGNSVQVDVRMLSKQALAGGSAEFAAGAEGAAGGSVIMLYEMRAQGQGPVNSVSNIIGRYRKVVGVPGGL